MPAVLRPLLDQYHAVPPEIRDRFLHACYWYERSGAAWSMSVSLGHIAAVTAIETLMEPSSAKPCPECGLDTSPGPTRRYRDFVERYAPAIPKEDRETAYRLRSALVHKGQPLDIDVPGPWGPWFRATSKPGTHTQVHAVPRGRRSSTGFSISEGAALPRSDGFALAI
jgi:hypothetical protein